MPITEAQREQRRNFIGSSDMPAIMGVDSYRNAADVYYAKLGALDDGDDTNDAAEAGNYLEPAILAWAADKLNVSIRRNQRRVRGVFAANIDAMIVDRPEALEAKTTGLYNPMFFGEEWGDEDTSQVPPRVLIQTHHQMYVASLERVWVPALINGRGLQLFRIERDETLIERIEDAGVTFWNEHVLKGIPPKEAVPSMETLKRIIRTPEKVASLDADTLLAYQKAKEEAKAAEAALDAAKAALIAALGDAEQGESKVGIVTYLEQSRSSVDTKALKEQYPEVAAAVTRETRYRVLREKKPKK